MSRRRDSLADAGRRREPRGRALQRRPPCAQRRADRGALREDRPPERQRPQHRLPRHPAHRALHPGLLVLRERHPRARHRRPPGGRGGRPVRDRRGPRLRALPRQLRQCHGDNGQGGIGPRLNDQGKLYNVLTPGGDAGTDTSTPTTSTTCSNVGGRYMCGDPDSLMALAGARRPAQLPAGRGAHRLGDRQPGRHLRAARRDRTAKGRGRQREPEVVSGWRDPDYLPGPEDTPVPACWKAPDGLAARDRRHHRDDRHRADPAVRHRAGIAAGTPEAPRASSSPATASLQFIGEDGAPVTQIDVLPARPSSSSWTTGPASITTSTSARQKSCRSPSARPRAASPPGSRACRPTWTVPETGVDGLQFACTVPGHYTPMHGDIVSAAAVVSPRRRGDRRRRGRRGGPRCRRGRRGGGEPPRPAALPDAPRVVNLAATAALQFLDEDGGPAELLDAVPGETIEFVIDNAAGFDHNFWIGPADELRAVRRDRRRHPHLAVRRADADVDRARGRHRGSAVRLHRARPLPPMHGDIVISG